MPKLTVTPRELFEMGWWERYCELTGTSIWSLRRERMAKFEKYGNDYVLEMCKGEAQILNDIIRSVSGTGKRRAILNKLTEAMDNEELLKISDSWNYYADDVVGNLTIL